MPQASDRVCACCAERKAAPFVLSCAGPVCLDCVQEALHLLFDRRVGEANAALDGIAP